MPVASSRSLVSSLLDFRQFPNEVTFRYFSSDVESFFFLPLPGVFIKLPFCLWRRTHLYTVLGDHPVSNMPERVAFIPQNLGLCSFCLCCFFPGRHSVFLSLLLRCNQQGLQLTLCIRVSSQSLLFCRSTYFTSYLL